MSKPENDLKAILVGGILILFVGAYFIGRPLLFHSQESNESEESDVVEQPTQEIPSIASAAVLEKIRQGESLAFIDVRDPAAYEREHIPHALSVPIGSLAQLTLDNEQTGIIVFASGNSDVIMAAHTILTSKSFPYFFLEGGFEEWKTRGYQVISTGDPNSFVDQSKITYITPVEMKQLIDRPDPNLFLLDVQPRDLYARSHVKGAVNIPLPELEKRSREIPPGKQIVVYGENALASFQGGVRLADLNFFGALTLQVGLENLQDVPLEP